MFSLIGLAFVGVGLRVSALTAFALTPGRLSILRRSLRSYLRFIHRRRPLALLAVR